MEETALNKPDEKAVGLRERKKRKTRLSVQQHAMRLFCEQGYDATTVEQIAEAAEISPSTFFRYFPTKESVALTDFYDPLIIESLLAQPEDIPPLEALRRAINDTFSSMTSEERLSEKERVRMIMSIPELRVALFNTAMNTFQLTTSALATRIRREPDDAAIRMLVGAFFGTVVAVGMTRLTHPEQDMDLLAIVDEAVDYLERGLPL